VGGDGQWGSPVVCAPQPRAPPWTLSSRAGAAWLRSVSRGGPSAGRAHGARTSRHQVRGFEGEEGGNAA